jgi:RNA polymerase sigma factor (sigma-70 family)
VEMHAEAVLVSRLLPGVNRDPADRVAAWNEWVERVGAASVLAFVRTKNDTAEPDMDILQEAMTIAYVEVERGNYEPRPGVPFAAYVKGIARNKIREARRRRRRWLPLSEVAEWRLPVTVEDVGARLERREEAVRLWASMARLPNLRRQVLERYLRGQTTGQIARALEMSEAAVRQHKSRALRSLRALWGEHSGSTARRRRAAPAAAR